MMRLLKQPNRWSCLPTAIAMLINKSVDDVIRAVGHDGSEIIWPELPEPNNRRSFHPQEMYPLIIENGYLVTVFDKTPFLANSPEQAFMELGFGINNHEPYDRLTELYERLKGRMLEINQDLVIDKFMEHCNGVLIGLGVARTPHAVAWNADEGLIYDPNGTVVRRNVFIIEKYMLLTRR